MTLCRCVLLSVTLVLVAAPASAQEPPVPPVMIGSDTVTVSAGSPGTLAVVAVPRPSGPGIRCVWFDLVLGSNGALSAIVPVSPVAGSTHLLTCIHPDDSVVAGYPVFVVYDPQDPVPGPAVSSEETARFALSQLAFDAPHAVLSPPAQQVVGIETWLAVTSRLEYGEVTAQAGPVWSTVRPVFRDVVWDMGDGRTVVCTDDVATLWSMIGSADGPSSQCTHVYERSSGEAGYDASATATWTILWRNDRDPSTWQVYGSLALSTPVTIDVHQLQAAIR